MKAIYSLIVVAVAALTISCANNANKPAEAIVEEVLVEEVCACDSTCSDSTECVEDCAAAADCEKK